MHRVAITRAIQTGLVVLVVAIMVATIVLANPALARARAQAAAPVTGKTIRVIDGDTFELLGAQRTRIRVRLAAIDAPERRQPWSQAAREALADRIAGQIVRVDGEKHDLWGRLVGHVFVDGVDVGLALVASGLAWHYKRFAAEQTEAARKAYARAESTARANRLGLWSDDYPTPPWQFRKRESR